MSLDSLIDIKLADIKKKLPAEDYNTIVKLALDEAETVIKDYCNIHSVPASLQYTHANMTADIVRNNVTQAAMMDGYESLEDLLSNVSSISLGDASISVKAQADLYITELKMSRERIDQLINNYTSALNRHRKVKW